MTTTSIAAPARIDWRRAEFLLTAFGFAGFLTLPIQITTVYGGLPAHPLFIHVPVVLIPLSILGALACLARPAWFERFGVLLCVTAVVAMSSIFLAMRAGSGLEHLMGLEGFPLLAEHSHYAHLLAFAFVAFTAVLILTFSATRIGGSAGPTGLALADRVLGARASLIALRMALVVLGLLSAFLVFKVGDLGAQMVWYGRLHSFG